METSSSLKRESLCHHVEPQLVDITCDLDLGEPGQETEPDQAGPGLNEAGLISDQIASILLTVPWLRPEGEPGEHQEHYGPEISNPRSFRYFKII